VKIAVDPTTPVVQLVQGLALVGLCLQGDGHGGLVIVQSPEYIKAGKTGGGYVPAFCRFEKNPETYRANF
jgi:hypothetical protein